MLLAAALANVFVWGSGRPADAIPYPVTLLSAVCVGLFFVALPLAAGFASRGGTVVGAIDEAMGPVLGIAFRAFALIAIADLVFRTVTLLSWPLGRNFSPLRPVVVLQLGWLGLAAITRRPVRAAWLSLKISTAVLIVALIRVRKGLPRIGPGSGNPVAYFEFYSGWPGVIEHFGVLALLGAVGVGSYFATRDRRQAFRTGFFGGFLPVAAGLLLAGAIGAAMHESMPFTRWRGVMEAVMSQTTSKGSDWRLLLLLLPVFAIPRLLLKVSAPAVFEAPYERRRWLGWLLLLAALVALGYPSPVQGPAYEPTFVERWTPLFLRLSHAGLCMTAGVLSAVALVRRGVGQRRPVWLAWAAVTTGGTAVCLFPGVGEGALAGFCSMLSYATLLAIGAALPAEGEDDGDGNRSQP